MPALPVVKTIACIDIGSNSVHLVVARVDEREQIEIVDTDKITLRLASYLDKKDVLSDAGIEACVQAVKKMVNIARHHTELIRCVATYTVRTAKNQNVLIEQVRHNCQVDIEVVNGREEAWLEFQGVRKALKITDSNTVLVDIGGGSTEITYYDSKKEAVVFAQSFNLGAVTLSKKFLSCETYSESKITKMAQRVHANLSGKLDIPSRKIKTAVASSGTAKAIAKMISRLFHGNLNQQNFNGYTFTAAELEKLYFRLSQCKSAKEIKNKFPIDEKRSEIILAGIGILREITHLLEIDQWTISIFSLREGLVVDTYGRFFASDKNTYDETRLQAIRTLANRFRLDAEKGRMLIERCMQVYDVLSKDEHIAKHQPIKDEQSLLRAACFLSEIGKSINFAKYHRHSAYIIRNCDIIGFTQNDLAVIATIVQFHRKSVLSSKKILDFPLLIPDVERLKFLSLCLRIATAVTRTWKKDFKFHKIQVDRNRILFSFPSSYADAFDVELFKLQSASGASKVSIGKDIFIDC